jgi:hypothetical protein
MAGSVSGSSSSDNSQQIQDFLNGKINITRNDLKNTVSAMSAEGEKPSQVLLDIIDSYDKIDTNGDGLSYTELKTYKNTPAGILSSLGLSAESLKQRQLNLSISAFLEDNSTASSPLFGNTDYFDSVMQAYSSSDTGNSSNILDLIT